MILLSAHKDTIMNHYNLSFKDGKFVGLLDNMIGMLAVNSLITEDPSISYLEKQNKVGVFFGSFEEWGLDHDFPKLTKKDLVVVVDVCIGKQYDKYDFSMENIHGIPTHKINEVVENLEWEGFKVLKKKYTGKIEDEDEAFAWVKKGIPVLSFIIPIEGESWHQDNCSISVEKFNKCKQGLRRAINYLL